MTPHLHLCTQKLSLYSAVHLREDTADFNICSRTRPEGRGRALHVSPQLWKPTFVSTPSCFGLLLSDSPEAVDALGVLMDQNFTELPVN